MRAMALLAAALVAASGEPRADGAPAAQRDGGPGATPGGSALPVPLPPPAAAQGAQAAQAEPRAPCPPGTQPFDAAPPEGFEVWCEALDRPPEQRREGTMTTWWDDGTPSREATYHEGHLHGPYTTWHRGGKRALAGRYEDDARAGTWTAWDERGAKLEELAYAKGLRQGPFAAWWPSGKKKAVGRYCQDLQCGRWTSWDENGRELGSMVYEELRAVP